MRFVKIALSDLDNLGWQLFAEKRCYLIRGGMREGDLIMKKLTGAILAAFVFAAVGSQGLVSAAAPMDLDLNGPALVLLDDAAEEEEASAEPAQAEEENNEEEPAAEQEQPANDANDDDEA